MTVSHFIKICQVLTILHQLICRGVANFGIRCRSCGHLLFDLYSAVIGEHGLACMTYYYVNLCIQTHTHNHFIYLFIYLLVEHSHAKLP